MDFRNCIRSIREHSSILGIFINEHFYTIWSTVCTRITNSSRIFKIIKSKKVSKLRGNSLYISSMIFSLIATLVFGVVDVVLRSKNDMYETIIANTRNVLDGEYLIIKGNSNLMDYIFIFVFIFLIFWFIGKGNKIDEKRIEC